ncbi:MAG: iron-containing alcohol dehydrogenase, partial [Calditrichota bacterium]
AVSHALESYVCTRHNAVSQLYAREAWRLLEANFDSIFKNPTPENWGNMLLGAHFSGMAIENSMLGAAHACANPLTAHFGITHGKAIAVMLPAVIQYNALDPATAELYHELMHAAGLTIREKGDVRSLIKRVISLIATAGLPSSIRELNVPESKLEQLAGDAAEQWTGTFNPRPVKAAELLEIYKLAYLGIKE